MGRPVIERGGGGMGLPEGLTGRGEPGPRSTWGDVVVLDADVPGASLEAAMGAKGALCGPRGAVADGSKGTDAGAEAGRGAAGGGGAAGRCPEGALAGLGEPGIAPGRVVPGGGGIGGLGKDVRGASTTSLEDLLTTRR